MTDQIAVIDDIDSARTAFCDALALEARGANVQSVELTSDGPWDELERARKAGTLRLVVTDLDLSKSASGIRGGSVVEWCAEKLVPVAVYSNAVKIGSVEPSGLFEIVVPADGAERYCAALYRGFTEIGGFFGKLDSVEDLRSPEHALALLLRNGKEDLALERQLAGYSIRIGMSAGNLLKRFVHGARGSRENLQQLLAYLTGHVLLNSVLRYPGPILNDLGLRGYFSTPDGSTAEVTKHLRAASYNGPFAETGAYFWRDILDGWINEHLTDEHVKLAEVPLRRAVLESVLERAVEKHGCKRCNGERGGFVCPFQKVIVCEQENCSVSSDSWLPLGATLCRVEKDHYDEWGPLLGR